MASTDQSANRLLGHSPFLFSSPGSSQQSALKQSHDQMEGINVHTQTANKKLFPTLETERLILRRMSSDDAEPLFDILSDDDVTRFMDIRSLTRVDEAIEVIDFMNRLEERAEANRWGIVSKENHKLIGTCGFNNLIRQHGSRAEIGYDLGKPYWGRGLMPEALSRMIEFGFQDLGLHRIEAMVLPGAVQSIRVLEKLRFQHEGLLRGYGYWFEQFHDEHVFSLLVTDWTANVRS